MLNSILQKNSQNTIDIAVNITLKLIRGQLRKFNICLAIVLPLVMANVLPAIAGTRIEGLNKAKFAVAEGETTDLNSSTISPFADGAYIFGQSPVAGEYGMTYIIFEVRQGITHGAFYEVASEYACFIGTVENQQLNLSVEDMDGESYPYAIAFEDRGTVVTNNGLLRAVGLQGFHKLEELNESDRAILKSCLEH